MSNVKTSAKDPSLNQCLESTCGRKPEALNFCLEHFDHFKFGTIKKNGQRVPDYDKKIIHFQKHFGKK